jgi:hypothetical protein
MSKKKFVFQWDDEKIKSLILMAWWIMLIVFGNMTFYVRSLFGA